MRKIYKKLTTLALGAALAISAVSLSGCSVKLDGDYSSGEVVSNGGFVVEKGNYIYFINGSEDYTADNDGDVVKASLMRIATSDFKNGNYENVETVVPSLLVAADYTSGIYIYGDRVYYATPTNAKNTSGETENSYLDFKSTRLDGQDTVSNYYFRSSDNTAQYRFTEVDGVVYCLHVVGGTDLYSYNTSTREDSLIALNATSILFDETSSESARVYYTMNVTVNIDSANAYTESYNQIYTAYADTKVDSFDYKTVSYTVNGKTYSFDEDYLEDNDDDFDAKDLTTYPYVNAGTLVFDGKGINNTQTEYNAESGTCFTPSGYTYTLVKADESGLYYTRDYVDTTESTGDGGWLFYAAEADMTSSSRNAIEDNYREGDGINSVVAYDTTDASSSAIFYRDGDTHYYLYVSGSAIYRNRVNADGSVAETVRIVNSASSPTLLYTDTVGTFGYLYYAVANTNGNGLYRAVYNGSESDYNAIAKNADYQPVQILNVDYDSAWYSPEIIENKLVFVNAESIGGSSYEYVFVVDLESADGDLMTNSEIAAFNELYEDITTVITDMQEDHSALGNLMYYYYYSDGFVFPEVDADDYYYEDATDFYHSILLEAADEGYTSTYLYSALYQSEFEKVMAHAEGTLGDYTFTDENGEYYGFRSYFYSFMGELTEDDQEAIINVWQTGMVLTLSDDDGLETWQKVLIGVGIGVGVIAIALGIAIPLLVHRKRKLRELALIESAKPRVRRKIDTTDDTSIDVYADDEEENSDGAGE